VIKLIYAILFFLFLLFSSDTFSQNKNEFNSDLFKINLVNNLLFVENNYGKEIYKTQFQNPGAFQADLDDDGIDELLVVDKIESGNRIEYSLYIYNLLDTFYLTSEINSGIVEPYETFVGEIEGLIIVSGNPDFSYMNEESEIKALPINCWKFEDGEIFSVNEDLYDIFLTENETLTSLIDIEDVRDCDRSKEIKSLIASVYINSLNAGEGASAVNFLKSFYLCDDFEKVKEELDNLFNKEK